MLLSFRGHSWWIKLLVSIQGAALAGYGLLLLIPVPSLDVVRDLILDVLAVALPGVMCLTRALTLRSAYAVEADPAQATDGRASDEHLLAMRRGYALLGIGCLVFAVGDFVYGMWVVDLHPVPDPCWADPAYLASYLLLAAGMFTLARAELGHRMPGGIWLDGLTGVLGTATVCSMLGLRVILSGLSGAPATLVTDAAYPILDVLLVSMVVGVVALRGGRPGPRWWWLGSGLTVFAAGDTIYLWRAAAGIYTDGTPLDLTWALGLNLIALATFCRPPAARSQHANGRAVIVLPVGASIAALAVLIAGHWVPIPSYCVGLAGVTLLAALARTVVAFRAAYLLTESRAQARTDDMTGLGNRRAFYEHAQAAVQRAKDAARRSGEVGRHPDVLGVLLLDLDRFKEINDSLGHHVGDQLLCMVSDRLASTLRPGDYLARLGGDEFVIVVPEAGTARAMAIANRLTGILATPFRLDGLDLTVSASIGVAAYPEHAHDVSGLLQCADVAMYQAKAAHSGCNAYDVARDGQTRDRLTTIEQLRHALEARQLVLHYQPQCDVRTGAVLGVEALVRWQHPDHGLIYPDDFLPLVEQTGLMPALTLYVLDQAIAQCGQWRLDGLDLTMSVNLSVSDLLDDGLPGKVANILTRYGVPAARLLLEVTENILMVDPDHATKTLATLHDLGIGLSVDDYGTGYCSLAYLRDLPVDELKLDKSFLHAATPGSRASAIVRSTIGLAHALGLRMIAEGVEDLANLRLLQIEGCDVAQGYYYTPALPADALYRWLRTRPAPVPDPTAEHLVLLENSGAFKAALDFPH